VPVLSIEFCRFLGQGSSYVSMNISGCSYCTNKFDFKEHFQEFTDHAVMNISDEALPSDRGFLQNLHDKFRLENNKHIHPPVAHFSNVLTYKYN
jgi:hypothetical protein